MRYSLGVLSLKKLASSTLNIRRTALEKSETEVTLVIHKLINLSHNQ